MRKSFIKKPSYISGIIALLFIITISLFIVIILIDEYDFYINLFFLFVLLIVYLPSILTLIFLFGYKINFNDEGIYTTLFNKNKKLISNYNEIKKVEIYTLRGLRIELTLNSNETIELEYRKEMVLLLIDNAFVNSFVVQAKSTDFENDSMWLVNAIERIWNKIVNKKNHFLKLNLGG